MSAIRPLATIAMLMVLGNFLCTRINTPGMEQVEESDLSLTDAPPLVLEADEDDSLLSRTVESGALPSDAEDSSAPESEFEFGPMPQESKITPVDTSEPGSMPELPPLPANIPTADYSGGESAGEMVPVPGQQDVAEGGEAFGRPLSEASPPGANLAGAQDISSAEVPAPPADTIQGFPELNSTLPTAITPDVPDLPTDASAEVNGPPSAFAAARPAIDAALERGELERAHLLLSGWYGDGSLTTKERDEVETLLSQLAGSVIYSQQHRLEPPHRVQPGETLETIARQYDVPWQLLAKINNVPQPSAVTPGQELKIVRGPFTAVVDIPRQQLALMVADRYAGRFSVKTEGEATAEGEWVVAQKQLPNESQRNSKQMLLEPATGAAGGSSLVLGPTSDASPASVGGAIRVGPQDQKDLFDILSVGSKVIIRK